MTIPRAPVFAAYTSPGPKYKLSTLVGSREHDTYSVYAKAPSYVFGNRSKEYSVSFSPGPKLSHADLYRDGAEGTPKYSLKSRTKQIKFDDTPSPLIYDVEKSKCHIYSCAPRYSISLPIKKRVIDFTPAPTYDLPTMMCETKLSNKVRAPAYSMMARNAWQEPPSSPGPAVYNVIPPDKFKQKAPVYSVRFRNRYADDRYEKTPGPGTHSTEKVWAHKKKAPQFTFGVRHSMYVTPLFQAD